MGVVAVIVGRCYRVEVDEAYSPGKDGSELMLFILPSTM
ncbi:unnamed protein product [Amoebophrya sp. A25]|nr:unnamed protein product [Amoebophrya sp. A25]|eukprot:GSA25T00008950001.1